MQISLDNARYRMLIDVQASLQSHEGKAMWKQIHMAIAPGIKVSGATKLQVIATLPHIKVNMTEHGAEVSYA